MASLLFDLCEFASDLFLQYFKSVLCRLCGCASREDTNQPSNELTKQTFIRIEMAGGIAGGSSIGFPYQ
ncbi:MAG: hypothetical protein ACPGLY_05410 [Rubripirellula sp.]